MKAAPTIPVVELSEISEWLDDDQATLDDAVEAFRLTREAQRLARLAEAQLREYVRQQLHVTDADPDPPILTEGSDPDE